MSRKNKTVQNPNPPQSLDLPETVSPVNEDDTIVSVQVPENTESARPALLDSLREAMSETDTVTTPAKKRGRKPGTAKTASTDTLDELSSILSLGILALMSSIREEVRPNDDEIGAVSERLVRIVSRHMDLSNKLTGDTLDVLAILATGTQWYIRVAPYLKQQQAQQQERPAIRYQTTEDTIPHTTLEVAAEYDAGSVAFLQRAHENGLKNE